MRSKTAAIIFGGFLLSPLLLFLAQIVLAAVTAPPEFPHDFAGRVTVGELTGDGLEIRVRVIEQGKLVTLDLTSESDDFTTGDGTFGKHTLFAVPTDNPDTTERDGANPGEQLFFFVVTGDGTGDATTKKPQEIDSANTVDIVLEAPSPQFIRGIPFSVDINVKPTGGQGVTTADAFLDFDPQAMQVVSVGSGDGSLNAVLSSFNNQTGRIDLSAITTGATPTTTFRLATVTFTTTKPVAKTDVLFSTVFLRKTDVKGPGGASVLRNVAGLEMARLVPAATSVTPVIFESSASTRLDLAIYGAPSNIDIEPDSPSGNPRPIFSWDPPLTGDITGEIDSFEVRIIPEQQSFTSIPGNLTSFTPGTGDFPNPGLVDGAHTFQVRAVGTGDRKDAIGTLDFFISTAVPVAPVLVFPGAGASINVDTPLFDWDPSSGDVVDYRLQVTSGDIDAGPYAVDVVIPDPTTQFQTTSALADDIYRWRVTVKNTSLNTASSATGVFTVDTVSPTAPANLKEETTGDELVEVFTWQRSTDPGFAGSGDPTNTGSGVDFYNIAITGPVNVVATADDSVSACPGNVCQYTTPLLVPGSYTIAVTAVDRATNPSPTSTADFRSGPLVVVQNLRVIDPIFGKTVNVTNPKFRWEPPPVLPTAGLKTYEIAITGDSVLAPGFNIPFTSFTNPSFFLAECINGTGDSIGSGDTCTAATATGDEIQITLLVLVPDGTHVLGVRVVDNLDVAGIVVPLTFTVDITPPGAPLLITPDEGAFESFPVVPFDWSDSTGDVLDYRFQVAVSGTDFDIGPFIFNQIVATSSSSGFLSDNVYQWRVIARDQALNTASSVIRTFTVDTLLPGAPVLVAPLDNALVNTSTPAFDWNASTGNPFGYQIQITSGDIGNGPYDINEVITGDITQFQVLIGDALSDVLYRWRVIARDQALNTASSVVRTFTVDTIPPFAPVLVAPPDNAFLSNRTPTLDWNPASGDVNDYRLVVASGDINTGTIVLDVVITGDTTEFQPTGDLADALYQWRVIARDAALNTALSVTRTFTVDTKTPGAPLLVSPANAAIVDPPVFLFSWQAATGDVFDYRIQIVTGDTFQNVFVLDKVVASTSAFEFLSLVDTTYRWRVLARDRALNTAASVSRTFIVDTLAPTVPGNLTEVTTGV